MRVTKITQRVGRTIQLGDNDYIKIDISKEVELGQIMKDGDLKFEDHREVQQLIFEEIKKEINVQTADLLNKKKNK